MRILTCIVLTYAVFVIFKSAEAKKKISRKKGADYESRDTPVDVYKKKIKKAIPKKVTRSLAEIDETPFCEKNCEIGSGDTIEKSRNFEDDMGSEDVIEDIESTCSKTLTKKKKKLKKEKSGERISYNEKQKHNVKKNKYLVDNVLSEKKETNNKKKYEKKEEKIKSKDVNSYVEDVDNIDAENMGEDVLTEEIQNDESKHCDLESYYEGEDEDE